MEQKFIIERPYRDWTESALTRGADFSQEALTHAFFAMNSRPSPPTALGLFNDL
jgi:hypothetical protein